MPKTEDIIQKSGVSRSTVFRFLRGNNVRPEARKAIIRAMQELGYSTKEIFLKNVVIEISVEKDFEKFKGFTEVVQGITERAEKKNIKIQLIIRTGDQIKRDYEQWSQKSNTKGVIIVGKDLENETLEAQWLKKKNIPHIFVNRVIEDPEISYVAVDVRKAACDIVEYLIQNGHRKIATLGYPDMLRIDRDKLAGYDDAFKKCGLKADIRYKYILENRDSSEDAIDAILKMK
ncbi:MAG: LacI family transcriptional regulator, partial [Clostridiaceae bacterium]|nr:LacI family transcriptional regulator [Clostridiaceae bacterium]